MASRNAYTGLYNNVMKRYEERQHERAKNVVERKQTHQYCFFAG